MLAELFAKYGSDKESPAHSYAKVYEDLLGHRREKIFSVLEIGIARGASLRAWRDYFPKATITGLDISSDLVSEDRIISFRADSTSADEVAAALGDPCEWFDVVIDDGDHHPDKQWNTRQVVWPRLKVGGVYVIEDVQWVQSALFFEEKGAKIYDMRHLRPGHWDNTMAVWHKDSA